MTDCPRFGKLFNGCKFEGRYDEGAPDLAPFKSFKAADTSAFLNSLKPKTYVHDICIRCGKTVKR